MEWKTSRKRKLTAYNSKKKYDQQHDKSQMYHIVNKLPFIIYGKHVFFLFNI